MPGNAPTVHDVAVIGGGVVGCAVLRHFAMAGARAVLLERAADILAGASKGNSGLLHTGFDAAPGSVEVDCVRAGHAEFLALRERLNLPALNVSGLVVAWHESELERLPGIAARARAIGLADVVEIGRAELRRREPHLAAGALGALLIPGEWIIDPWSTPLAYAHQALANGAEIRRRCAVTGGELRGGRWRLATSQGTVDARVAINCAGLHGDIVEAIGRPSPFRIRPRKGQFVVFDKSACGLVNAVIMPVPTERTRGVLVAPTIFGNLLVGPTAEEQEDREDAATDEATCRRLVAEGVAKLPALEGHAITAVYAGLRPATERQDYRIEALPERRWITVAGIRSTGLTGALGIARRVGREYDAAFGAPPGLADPAWPAVANLAEGRPRPYQQAGRGEIVCHCEMVTRSEIEAALAGPLAAGDVGGLKRRTRCMMGRCQGFYCAARVAELAAGRLDPPLTREAAA